MVEGAVKLIYRSVYTRLEGHEFYDLLSLNSAIRSALELHNNKPFSGRTYSRRDQFEEIEREVLGPLNHLRYEVKKQVYYRYTPVAQHPRTRKKYHYTTDPKHLASQHRFITE